MHLQSTRCGKDPRWCCLWPSHLGTDSGLWLLPAKLVLVLGLPVRYTLLLAVLFLLYLVGNSFTERGRVLFGKAGGVLE